MFPSASLTNSRLHAVPVHTVSLCAGPSSLSKQPVCPQKALSWALGLASLPRLLVTTRGKFVCLPIMAISSDVYHEGELAVQRKVGTAEQAERYAAMVQPLVNQQLALFVEKRSDVIVASADSEGRLWASILFGAPGFMRITPDSAALLVGTAQAPAVDQADPLHDNSRKEGAALGFLFIEMHTRRRNRINGSSRPERAAPGGLFVEVHEAFGNCPKYITGRTISRGGGKAKLATPSTRSKHLGPSQQRLIAQADMMFVATAKPGGGADTSHRGGLPGFVRVLDEQTLVWPDYTGNGMFMTLGNLLVNPSAGLLFIDWDAHSLLQLTGHAQVLFEADIQQRQLAPLLGGAERAVVFTVKEALFRPNSVPFNYEFLNYSPYNYPVPSPVNTDGAAQKSMALSKQVRLVGTQQVTSLVKEFTFETGAPLHYLPGQYATFDLHLPRKGGGALQRVTRSWTVTSTAQPGTTSFAIAVKRLPGGQASLWLHDVVQRGTCVQLVTIGGDFSCFEAPGRLKSSRLLLLSAGIGVTPMLAMLRGLREVTSQELDVVGVHTSRTAADVPFRSEMLVDQGGAKAGFRFVENLTVRDGRVTAVWLRTQVPDVTDRQVYLCGPTAYMTHMTAILEALGVSAGNIHTESFSY